MSTIRAVVRRFTSRSIAPCRSIAPSRSLVAASQDSGTRLYSSFNDDYRKAMVRALYCNHPNCDNWDDSNGLSDPINMIDHWKHVHKYKGTNFCEICGNCFENDKLPCKSFPPLEECPNKYNSTVPIAELVGKKPRARNAAKRNLRRRPQAKFTTQDKPEISKSKKEDDDDNSDMPEG